MNNAGFGKRLLAYFIDMILISFIVSFIMVFIPTKEVDTTEANKIMEQYIEGKITAKEYINKVSDTNYDVEQNNVPTYIVSLTITFVYFVILQFKLKGQTIGKKIMNIKVANNDNKDLKINDLIFRSLINNEIAFSMLNILSILLLKGNAFNYTVSILSLINFTIIFACAIMIIATKEKRGLHDLAGHTKVIEMKM